MGKFVFQGKVTDENGNPVPNAWVKVRGWETLTDERGNWQEEQIVDCGAMRDHVGSYDESNEILVMADGYEPASESFLVKHPALFGSCEPQQTVAFDVVLKSSNETHKGTADGKQHDGKTNKRQKVVRTIRYF